MNKTQPMRIQIKKIIKMKILNQKNIMPKPGLQVLKKMVVVQMMFQTQS